MAKQLDWISFNINGVEGSDSSATLTACVCDSDDNTMKKTISTTCALPAGGQAYDAWRAAQITAFKAANGIS